MSTSKSVSTTLPPSIKVAGIAAMVLSIIAWFIPILGVLFITPMAIIAACVAMYGGYKTLAVPAMIICAIKMAISPTFWLNLAAGGADGAFGNRLLALIDIFGLVTLIYLAVRPASRTR